MPPAKEAAGEAALGGRPSGRLRVCTHRRVRRAQLSARSSDTAGVAPADTLADIRVGRGFGAAVGDSGFDRARVARPSRTVRQRTWSGPNPAGPARPCRPCRPSSRAAPWLTSTSSDGGAAAGSAPLRSSSSASRRCCRSICASLFLLALTMRSYMFQVA